MKKIYLFILIYLLIFSTPVFAAEKIISATGMYIAGASESLNDAKQNALQDAMRQAAEQAGVFVNSYSKTHNMELTEDEVTIVATKIIHVTNKKFHVELLSDSEIKVISYIDVVVDTNNINEDIIALKNKSEKLETEKKELQKDLQLQKDAVVNAEKLTKEIRDKYDKTISYIPEKQLFTDSPWYDFYNNFSIDMDNRDYSGAEIYIYGAILKYRNEKVPPMLSKVSIFFDDKLFDLCIKLIEAYITEKSYQGALGYCYFVKNKIEGHKELNIDNNKKLNLYTGILEDYFRVYNPKMIKVLRESPRPIWK